MKMNAWLAVGLFGFLSCDAVPQTSNVTPAEPIVEAQGTLNDFTFTSATLSVDDTQSGDLEVYASLTAVAPSCPCKVLPAGTTATLANTSLRVYPGAGIGVQPSCGPVFPCPPGRPNTCACIAPMATGTMSVAQLPTTGTAEIGFAVNGPLVR